MPNSVSAGRSRLAVLAALATLVSLFVFPGVASAADGTVDDAALHEACPAGVAPDAGFTDVAGNFAEGNVDCVAYYGITQGTSATTYSPGDVVTREQMALFLIRAAGPAGITVPAASDQGLTDIAGLPQASQDAINQLVDLGISTGTSTTTYAPGDAVSRYQMALFLGRFLDLSVIGPGGTAFDDATADDTVFTDINNVSVEAYNAIRAIYDLGVTTGTTATTFSPFDAVDRAQMAAFINRTLDHTNARPAGVNIQTSATDGFGARAGVVAVTYRDASFMPMANVLIDVFNQNYASNATTIPAPLNADGTCNLANVTATSPGTACTITNGDFATNSSGNYVVGSVTTTNGNTDIWWAWSGAIGDTFDVDTDPVSSIKVVSTTGATTYTATASSTLIKFGSTATVTLKTDNPQSGVEISVTETRTQGANVSATTTKVTTAADGTATYTVAAYTDPNTATGDSANSVLTFASSLTDPGSVTVNVSDATSVATTLSVDSTVGYAPVGTTASVKTVSATIKDQYGAVMANEPVSFDLNAGGAVTRTSNASGVATFSWSGGTANGADVIVIDSVNVPAVTDVTFTFYWADELAVAANTAASPVVVWDAANDILVYNDAGTYEWVKYESGDQFSLGGPTTYTLFDEAVGKEPAGPYTNVTVTNYTGTVASFSLG